VCGAGVKEYCADCMVPYCNNHWCWHFIRPQKSAQKPVTNSAPTGSLVVRKDHKAQIIAVIVGIVTTLMSVVLSHWENQNHLGSGRAWPRGGRYYLRNHDAEALGRLRQFFLFLRSD
jgi:hypothetical protein